MVGVSLARGLFASIAGFVLLLGVSASATASTLTVNTTTDELTSGDGLCSLREAIGTIDAAATSGDCGAVQAGANTIALGSGDFKLVFPPSGADANTNGDLNISSNVSGLTIAGKGPALTTIDASALGDRVLEIGNGAVVTLSGLTLTGGHASDGSPGSKGANVFGSATGGAGKAGSGGEDGGGVFNDGSLTLTEVDISGNTAGNGGPGGEGGSSESGKGGTGGTGGAGGQGGGIFNNAGTLTLLDSTIAENSAGAGGKGGTGGRAGSPSSGGTGGNGGAGGVGQENGGGVSNEAGTVTIKRSTIAGNSTGAGGEGGSGGNGNTQGGNGGNGGSASWGGGISSIEGLLHVENSTITANSAGAGGTGGHGGDGGFREFRPPSTEEFCSPGGGGSGGNGGAGGDGGGVRVTNVSSALFNVTVARDSVGAPGPGGEGGFSEDCGGGGSPPGSSGSYGNLGAGSELFQQGLLAMMLEDSIVVGNSIGKDCSGSFTSAGQLDMTFGDTTCIGTVADPKLGPLQDNGGPTETIALGAASPALDLVPALEGACPSTDQRGVHRPQGGGCDLGAYELASPAVVTGEASSVGLSSAAIAGLVTANASDASVRFEFGTSLAYGSQTPVQHVGGVEPVAVSASLAGLMPNTTYHYRLLAATGDGEAAGVDRTFTTNALGLPSGGTGATSGTSGGATSPKKTSTEQLVKPPSITGLRIAPSAFSSTSKRRRARKHIAGTTISYDDTQAATTTLDVLLAQPGVVKGGRCTKVPRSKPVTRARRCTRYLLVGSFAHIDLAGHNSMRFSGRLNRRPLARGKYRLRVTPSIHGMLGATVSASFQIV